MKKLDYQGILDLLEKEYGCEVISPKNRQVPKIDPKYVSGELETFVLEELVNKIENGVIIKDKFKEHRQRRNFLETFGREYDGLKRNVRQFSILGLTYLLSCLQGIELLADSLTEKGYETKAELVREIRGLVGGPIDNHKYDGFSLEEKINYAELVRDGVHAVFRELSR